MSKRRVVITGLGILAPNGIGTQKFWDSNINGISGIDYISTIDTTEISVKIAGEVRGFNPLDYMNQRLYQKTTRFSHFGIAAAQMAINDSNISIEKINPCRFGVIMGSGLGGMLFHEEQILNYIGKGLKKVSPLYAPLVTPNAVTGNVAVFFGLRGINYTVGGACASGNIAIGEAFRKIQYNEADIMLTGGVEASLYPTSFAGFANMGVLSKRNVKPNEASCPFSLNRDGFVLSEGGGILLLEELNHALKRNANIYCEIIGFGANNGAHHMVIPNPDGSDATAAMELALADGSINSSEVNYINAHGTSTQANDKIETLAIRKLFTEPKKISISSTKSMIGHSLGASSGIEAIVTCLAIKNNIVPPTINLNEPDPECDLDYTPNVAKERIINVAMSNSFAFGSINACIVLKKYN